MTLEEIKDAVRTLPEGDFSALRFWMNEHDDADCDRRIKHDLESGRFDALLAKAKEDAIAGRTNPLSRESYDQYVDDSLADAADAGFFDEMAKAAIANDEAGKTTPLFPWKSR